jgi:hypothetical protein
MKRILIGLVFFAACSYADIPPPLTISENCNPKGPNKPNSVTGVLGAPVGSATSGCLTVGGFELVQVAGKNTIDENLSTDGLWVNPGTNQENPNFQDDKLTVMWAVTNQGGGVYQYEYTFLEQSMTSANNVSHIVLGVGNQCTSQTALAIPSDCIYNLEALSNNPNLGSIGLAPSTNIGLPVGYNPELPPSITHALTLLPASTISPNNDGYTVVFESKEAPAWENIYVRDGGESGLTPAQIDATSIEAWNNSAAGFYVAAPVPEAGFYVLFTVFMAGLLLVIRFNRKQRDQA